MLARQVKAALNSVAPKPGGEHAAAGAPAAAYWAGILAALLVVMVTCARLFGSFVLYLRAVIVPQVYLYRSYVS